MNPDETGGEQGSARFLSAKFIGSICMGSPFFRILEV